MNNSKLPIRACVGVALFAAIFSGCRDDGIDRVNAGGPPRENSGAAPSTPAGNAASDTKDVMNEAIEMNSAEVQLGRLAQNKSQNGKVRQFASMMVTDHTAAIEHLRGGTGIGPVTQRETPRTGAGQDDKAAATDRRRNSAGEAHDSAKAGSVRSRTADESVPDVPLKPMHQQTLSRLNALSGTEFDKEFMNVMVQSHRDALQFFETHFGNAATTHATAPPAGSQAQPHGAQHPPSADTEQRHDMASQDHRRRAQELVPKIRQHLEQAEQIQRQLNAGENER